ncbi:MAG: AMP-binding protein [Pseudolabrys sp.]
MNAPLTLDGLFRRAGVRSAQAPALIDPPNRASFTDGAPRALSFAQTDRAISAFAASLRGLGLSTGTVVGLQLPNTVESVIAFLGTVRAGMIAAPLPVLWRRLDMVEALRAAGAKAIVTAARIGDTRHAELAMEVAAELFPIRQICAFGSALPDGVVPLDGVFAGGAADPPPQRMGVPSAQVVAMTFDSGADGIAAVPHDQAYLLEAGVALAERIGLPLDASILATIPLSSFAGLTVSLLPWLIAGGALHLHHGFDAEAFIAQSAELSDGAVVLPGPVLSALADAVAESNRIVALWRAPLGAAARTPVSNVIDCLAHDESSVTAATRTGDGLPDAAIVDAAARIVIPGAVTVGAYRFRQTALDAAVAAVDPSALIAALPDALLGNRLAGHASDAARIAGNLFAHGANPLVAGAFRARSVS